MAPARHRAGAFSRITEGTEWATENTEDEFQGFPVSSVIQVMEVRADAAQKQPETPTAHTQPNLHKRREERCAVLKSSRSSGWQ
jgi:hypothetical protein